MNFAVQVSANQTGYLHSLEKNKHGKHRENYHRDYYQNHRAKYQAKDTQQKDRHKLNFKTRHWVRFLKQENYLLTPLEGALKGMVLSGCETPHITLKIGNKNLFFLKNKPTEPYFLERQKDYLFAHLVGREKEELNELLRERPRQFRKRWNEIKVKVEILSQWNHPTKLVPGYKEKGRPKPSWEGGGWNSPDYWETKNRSLAALAFTHEIVLGKIGTDTPLLDLDPNKKDSEGHYRIKQAWLRKSLSVGGKKWKALIRKYQLPYYWTTATPGNSCLPLNFWMMEFLSGSKIYHPDTQQAVADLLAGGDLVALPVGGDKKRQLVITEWGRKLVKKYGVEGILRKSLVSGKKGIEELLRSVHLSLDKSEMRVKKRRKNNFHVHHLKGVQKPLVDKDLEEFFSVSHPPEKGALKRLEQGGRMAVQAQILSKEKTALEEIWKVVYWGEGERKYFLLNEYQRGSGLAELEVGEERNIWLVKGRKHAFFSRMG